ncbi:MAG: glutamine synthetase [Deltaproteobacteria bacterium]|nr:glutamine synthetase [Deltaproteobacteria bacterium]
MESVKIRNFMEITYEQLEELNLAAKRKMLEHADEQEIAEQMLKYLADERQIKAVTIAFSDIEGRFHMLDFDKKFLLRARDELTFDGSSIRGFAVQQESDLRLSVDWPSFRWLPSDIFGAGKVMVFGLIRDRGGRPYEADLRGRLKAWCQEIWDRDRSVADTAVEVEGFLFQGMGAEQGFLPHEGFRFVSEGGYFHSLPLTPLKQFIDRFAEAQRAMGFENEKDHPEVAPSQFELNYTYCDSLVAADQIQLYKLLARQIAASMGYTASFLPKPRVNINGSGMHTNISMSRAGENLMFDGSAADGLSELGRSMARRLLHAAGELCLVMNSSVNSYRRLDPAFEAPNQIRASAVDRTAMIRIPLNSRRAARLEVRSVAPDANPYMLLLALFRTALEGTDPGPEAIERDLGSLPDNIHAAIDLFERSELLAAILGRESRDKYAALKKATADRCPKELGTRIKSGEVLFHHEVCNQHIWAQF